MTGRRKFAARSSSSSKPELLQAQVAHHLRLEHRDDVGRARDAVAGPQLLGDAGAAEDVAALEDAHAHAGAREVRARGQPVVAAADDDRVEARHDATSVPASASR
jgi:hypothetical protein